MDAEAKKEIDALKAQLKAQSDGQAALIAAAVSAAIAASPRHRTELQEAQEREAAAMKAKVAAIKSKALENGRSENPGGEPKVLKYVVGNVPHYRAGALYHPGDLIALPNDDDLRHNPSHTWEAYSAKAQRGPTPAEAAEAKALSQLQKEQAPKALGVLAPKKAGRPSDTEV